MRSIFPMALGLALLLCVPSAKAVDQSVTVNPAGLLGQGPWVQWERAVEENQSYALRGGASLRGSEQWRAVGFGLGANYSYYLLGRAPSGLFVNGGVDAHFVRMPSFGEHRYGLILAPQAMLGYNHVFGGGFTLGLAGGIDYGVPLFLNNIDIQGAFDHGRIRPLFAANVGYSW